MTIVPMDSGGKRLVVWWWWWCFDVWACFWGGGVELFEILWAYVFNSSWCFGDYWAQLDLIGYRMCVHYLLIDLRP